MKPIAELFGATIAIDMQDEPTLAIEWVLDSTECDPLAISGLVTALGGMGCVTRDGRRMRAAIPYKDALDDRLVRTIDVLIAIRYNHPRMVQLPLALTEDEARELAEVMGE